MYITVMSSRKLASLAGAQRCFATMRITRNRTPVAQSIITDLPAVDFANEPAPEHKGRTKKKMDQFRHSRKPVTSAHAIDVKKGEISNQDSAAINGSGSVVHGRYGELGPVADAIPLEYLALLRHAAEGAAGLRVVAEGQTSPGTFLVYGATEANGMAAAQIASAAGHAVVGVAGGEHSGNELMMESLKGLINEPGTAVPDVYALSKKNFADLVDSIASGDEHIEKATAEEYVEDFKENLLNYVVAFPGSQPAAVDAAKLKFSGMDKDREFFSENMEAFLAQYPPGSPPIEKSQLDALFSKDQYEVFRKRFWDQTTDVISGIERNFFSPPHIVKELLETSEKPGNYVSKDSGAYFPYSFSVLNQSFPEGSASPAGGPVMGAVISVTPVLESAAKTIGAAKTLRQKGEALSFLTSAEKTAFGAASSVAEVARKHGAPVYAIGGSLPGLDSVEPTDEDVKQALAAMDVDEDGSTKLNYFVQSYRACDFPFYGDYAVHRATEEMAGPRQIVVAK